MTSSHFDYPDKLIMSDPSKSISTVGVLDPLLPEAAIALTEGETTSEPQRGILHLYRDINEALPYCSSNELEDRKVPDIDRHRVSPVVCTIVPSSMAIADFLDFVAPVDPFVSNYRMLRGKDSEMYMVLMKFRNAKDANDYYWQYNNRPFSSMDPEICQLMFITSVEVNAVFISPYTSSFLCSKEGNDEDSTMICPVCLEIMDESLTSLLTILCQHTFHSHCLSKWGDGSCPVCRYTQKPKDSSTSISTAASARSAFGHITSTPLSGSLHADECLRAASHVSIQHQHQQLLAAPAESVTVAATSKNSSQCLECDSTEDLWVCLICGHIGCGNDKSHHASRHYAETSHPYALEIETQRVWDHAGNG
ncbi:BRCA1-associated protein 2-domain-containing protein [Dichotomocladium elegans]|nr:BRCA1-associated protein 2-domain-containing protein [Dichotomocladium elegans]